MCLKTASPDSLQEGRVEGRGSWLQSDQGSDLSPVTGGQGSPLCPCRQNNSPLEDVTCSLHDLLWQKGLYICD